jgi:hypothetical protein
VFEAPFDQDGIARFDGVDVVAHPHLRRAGDDVVNCLGVKPRGTRLAYL